MVLMGISSVGDEGWDMRKKKHQDGYDLGDDLMGQSWAIHEIEWDISKGILIGLEWDIPSGNFI